MFTEHPGAARSVPPEWRDLPVEHLQLKPSVNEALRRRGVCTVGEALAYADSSRAYQFPHAPELFESARLVRRLETSSGIDWHQYWSERQFRFHHLAASLPCFDKLGDELASVSVDRRSLGNPGAMLQASGVRTFAQLIAGLRGGLGPVRGIGLTKVDDLFGRLFELVKRLEGGCLPQLNRVSPSLQDPPADLGPPPAEPMPPPAAAAKLPDDIRELPLSVLQIGVKSQWLQNAGLKTIGDLTDDNLARLNRLRAVGPRTVKAIRKKLEEFAEASTTGSIDWRKFSQASGLPLIPSEPLTSASEMLLRLPDIVETIGPYLKDDSYRDVLFHRLTKGPGHQATLEQLARRATPAVTRERIRQKEKKLLRQLAGTLIWDVDRRLGIQFHPSFVRFWRQAAAEFEGEEEISFETFVTRLAAVWDVDANALTRQLPFIVALVTGDPQMPAAFRAACRLDPVLFALTPEAAATPLKHFRIGRIYDRLDRRGIRTLDELVRACAKGLIGQDASNALSTVAASIRADGSLDWSACIRDAGLAAFPDPTPRSAEEFLAQFSGSICTLLSRLHNSDRRAEIFRVRTSQPVRTRPTLDAVARLLSCYGPTVKREETLLLQELNDILVDRDFSGVPLWLESDWLEYIGEAEVVFRSCGNDYAVFLSRIASHWDVSLDTAELAAPGFWAIFTGYPEGRRRRRGSADDTSEAAAVEPARIRLQGFRRLH